MDNQNIRVIPFLFIVSLFMSFRAASDETCLESICGRGNGYLTIRFPFYNTNIQPKSCGYPGFDLYCDASNKTLLYLPHSGNFSVQGIDYRRQEILLSDPDDCLPKKLLSGLELSHTPFSSLDYYNLSFYNCSEKNENYTSGVLYQNKISCLSTVPNYATIGVESEYVSHFLEPWCDHIGNVRAPGYTFSKLSRLNASMLLSWVDPQCGLCEGNFTRCGFKKDGSTLETMCIDYDPPIARRLSRRVKYTIGFSIGLGVPAAILFVLLLCKVAGCCRRPVAENDRDTAVEMASH